MRNDWSLLKKLIWLRGSAAGGGWKTIKGIIAHFVVGTASPLRSLVADIDPVQDLHGQDSPYPSGGQLWDEQWVAGIYNSTTGLPESSTSNIRSVNPISIEAGVEIYVYDSDSGGGSIKVCFYDSNDTYLSNVVLRNQKTTTPSNTAFIRFSTTNYGTTYKNNISINYPSTDTAYHPYSNICPISGTTEVEVVRAGKNLFDKDNVVALNDCWLNTTTNTIASGGGNRGVIIPILGGATYTLSVQVKNATDLQVASFADVPIVGSVCIDKATAPSAVTNKMVTITTSANAKYLFVKYNNTNTTQTYTTEQVLDGLMLELGSTATAYEPYVAPLTITTQLGQTVYGGTVDVVSGVLTIEKAMVDLGTLDWTAETIGQQTPEHHASLDDAKQTANGMNFDGLSEKYKSIRFNAVANALHQIALRDNNKLYVTGTESPTGKLCYELAIPITYQLTPQEVTSLLGGNTVWADSGDVEVTYKADIQRYIDKKISAVLNA